MCTLISTQEVRIGVKECGRAESKSKSVARQVQDFEATPPVSDMKIVAIIATRNEEAHIANSLRHLIANGIYFAILDCASTDSTVTIVTGAEFCSHLVGLE